MNRMLRAVILCLLFGLMAGGEVAAQGVGSSFWTRSIVDEPLYFVLSRALKGVSFEADLPRLRLSLVELARGQPPLEPESLVLLLRYKRKNYAPLREKEFILLRKVARQNREVLKSKGIYRFFEAEAALYWLQRLDFSKAEPFLLSLAESKRVSFSRQARIFLGLHEVSEGAVPSLWLESACLQGPRLLHSRDKRQQHPAGMPAGLSRTRVEQARCALFMLLELKQQQSMLKPDEFKQTYARLQSRASSLLKLRNNVANLSLFSEQEWPKPWLLRLRALESFLLAERSDLNEGNAPVSQVAPFSAQGE